MPLENYSLEIESDPNKLIIVEEFVNYFAKDIGLNDDKLNALLLAITEATTNAMIHGNKSDINKNVNINVDVLKDKLIIKVKDEGAGFDVSKVPDPTEPENLLKDSGRGIYLMKVYMHDIKYNVTPTGTETILEMEI